MNLAELSDLLERSTHVLRVETLGSYLSDTDRDWLAAYLRGDPKPDIELKRPWLDRLAVAAERGHPWMRLRIIPRPVPDYVRYACEWSYVDNVAVGEEIRVMDQADWPSPQDDDAGTPQTLFDARVAIQIAGDFYVADDQVVTMRYSSDGRFIDAALIEDALTAGMHRSAAKTAWIAYSSPFDEWWADSPELHRDVTV